MLNKDVINAITFRLMELETLDQKLDLLTEIFCYTEEVRHDLCYGDSELVSVEEEKFPAGEAFDYCTGLPL